jgi:hypothetical protein
VLVKIYFGMVFAATVAWWGLMVYGGYLLFS